MNALNQAEQDFFYMDLALDEAKKALEYNEVPIAALIVYQGEVLTKAHNFVETEFCVLSHAECLCIQQASKILQNWRLQDCTLYCTLEPCSMCAGAILLSRIPRLVYGAPDIRHGAHGSWIDLFSPKHPCHALEIVPGIRSEESAALLRNFFRKRRLEK